MPLCRNSQCRCPRLSGIPKTKKHMRLIQIGILYVWSILLSRFLRCCSREHVQQVHVWDSSILPTWGPKGVVNKISNPWVFKPTWGCDVIAVNSYFFMEFVWKGRPRLMRLLATRRPQPYIAEMQWCSVHTHCYYTAEIFFSLAEWMIAFNFIAEGQRPR